jgi:hypothetical protein
LHCILKNSLPLPDLKNLSRFLASAREPHSSK